MSGVKRIRKNRFKAKKRKRTPAASRTGGFGTGAALLRFFLTLGLLLGLSAGCVLVHETITRSPFFSARTITLDGNHRLDRNALLRQAGIYPGINIFAVNLNLARKKLLAHSWVAEARVSRQIPNRLALAVTEHRPLAVVDLGRRFVMDTQGRLFKESKADEHATLPLISGMAVADFTAGAGKRSRSYRAVMQLLKLGRDRRAVLPNADIKQIRVDRDIGLTVYHHDREKRFKLGFRDYPAKLARLRKIEAFIKRSPRIGDYNWIDLQRLDRVVVHPVKLG